MKWLGAAWLFAVVGAMTALAHYKAKPGAPAEAPAQWPQGSAVPRVDGVPTLLVVVHPFCPCSRATLTELARLTSRLGPKVSARVLFLKPKGTSDAWERSDLWDKARAIRGVEVLADQGGDESRRFGALTSGQALLYSARGALQFKGGLTISRGHEGDSPGAQRVVALVEGTRADRDEAPVFGCELNEADKREEVR